MSSDRREPLLLTPGPLTTALETRQAMLRDWGSRDRDFIAMNGLVRERLTAIAGGQGTHVCVPLQGSGTMIVEATLATLVPPSGKVLVLINGAYGQRIAKILELIGRLPVVLETPEDVPTDAAAVEARLAADPAIGHVVAVLCETTSGILNPVSAIAAVVAKLGRRLIVDAMSAFGAIPLDARQVPFDAIIASSGKCLEGVPGMGFAIIRTAALQSSAGNARSLSFDLHDHWVYMEKTAQWRHTPPTHVIAALDRALETFVAEGGIAGRGARYAKNCSVLVSGMADLGFEALLPAALQAPIIVTFHPPADPHYSFETFYEALRQRGYLIYPGKVTTADTFRIGCIGRLDERDMANVVAAVRAVMAELGIASGVPGKPLVAARA
ncbi:MAG: 2-aminoethylphosphonate--pyruvate transaminase [Rhodospirillales bacterium]|nr:2-aminoethylphosphonate--pyruvate transaminase [Rhodospirillales bacterium]